MCHAIYPDGGHFVTRGTENLIQYHPLPEDKAKKESKYGSFYSPWFGYALDGGSIKRDHPVIEKNNLEKDLWKPRHLRQGCGK